MMCVVGKRCDCKPEMNIKKKKGKERKIEWKRKNSESDINSDDDDHETTIVYGGHSN
jgi:hypothetical protein